jgi:hypothetical protein
VPFTEDEAKRILSRQSSIQSSSVEQENEKRPQKKLRLSNNDTSSNQSSLQMENPMDLPDDLLRNIFSFLKMKERISSSSVSRKWKELSNQSMEMVTLTKTMTSGA